MNLFEVIETIATKQNMVSVLKQLEEIRAACHEKDLFDLLILGQFKAGKSSFINQFLGSNLLPTGVLPVTAIVTRIRFGEKRKAVIHYFNHKKEEIAPARLWEFVTESENPENKKKVSVVDLYVPDIKHLNPLRLVDTPGIGSILNHNSLVTHSWLGKIKAAIVVISAVQPLSDNDVTLIREAMEQSPKVYILLSKTDLVTGRELDQINTFINNKLQEIFNRTFDLFPFSIQNQSDFKETILNKIFIPLVHNSESIQKEVCLHKLRFLAKKTIGYLKISREVVKQKEEEREKLKAQIVDESLNIKYLQKELFQIGENYKSATRDLLKEILLKNHAGPLTEKLTDNFMQEYETWRGNLAKVTQQYEQWIRSTMVSAIKKVEMEEWESISAHPSEARLHFNNYLRHFKERLNQNIKKVLNIDMPPGEIEIVTAPLPSPSIHISRTFDSHIDMLWFLVPMPVFKKMIKKHFLNEIPKEVEKNSYRLIAGLTANINQNIEIMQQRAVNYITHELESVALAIMHHQPNENNVTDFINLLEKEIATKPKQS